MRTRRLIASFCLLALAATATVQTPEQYFGFRIGSDKKLVRWDKIVEYHAGPGQRDGPRASSAISVPQPTAIPSSCWKSARPKIFAISTA